ncbi:MAG: hypothetical protein EOP53_03160 [Sphingobacteriales bacterium]|nr:MAG: hypothetical protein EOP53_03160 [Sphingobacteriales bacterium]
MNSSDQKCLKLLYAITILCFWLTSPFSAQAQEFYAKASVEKDTFIVGDSINVRVEFNFPAGHIYMLQKMPRLQSLEFLDSSALLKQNKDRVKTITITGFDSGQFTLPPLEFDFLDATGKLAGNALTEPLQINIKYADVDTSKDIKPIKAPIQVDYKPFPYWILVLIAVFILIGFLLSKLRKKPKPEKIPVQPVVAENNINYIEEHIRKIEALQESEGNDQKFWFGLKEILRSYISRQYKIATQEKTSAQILNQLKKEEVSTQYIAQLENIFKQADLVLFANQETQNTEKQAGAAEAVSFIKQSSS